jgi:hypothetical protein
MKRITFLGPAIHGIQILVFIFLAWVCALGSAPAQRMGGRPGGVSGPGRLNVAPRVAGPHVIVRGSVFHSRPTFLIFPRHRLWYWTTPIFGFGPGYGFSSTWWNACGTYWTWQWGYNCYTPSFYVSESGGGGRDLQQLYTKDGTVYNVTDYWLVDGQLHFTTLDESETHWNEHTVNFDDLDLQKTVEVSNQRGFRFVLRNEPAEQYLLHHPEIGKRKSEPENRQPDAPQEPPSNAPQ